MSKFGNKISKNTENSSVDWRNMESKECNNFMKVKRVYFVNKRSGLYSVGKPIS